MIGYRIVTAAIGVVCLVIGVPALVRPRKFGSWSDKAGPAWLRKAGGAPYAGSTGRVIFVGVLTTVCGVGAIVLAVVWFSN